MPTPDSKVLRRLVARHLRRQAGDREDATWAQAKAREAMGLLESIADVLGQDRQPPSGVGYEGFESLASTFPAAQAMVDACQRASQILARPSQGLQRIRVASTPEQWEMAGELLDNGFKKFPLLSVARAWGELEKGLKRAQEQSARLRRVGVGRTEDATLIMAEVAPALQDLKREIERVLESLEKAFGRGGSRLASRGQRLDNKLRRPIANAFKAAGLDGNGRFRKAQEGYSKAIEMDEIVSSHHFNQDSGNFTIRLAYSNPEDSFSPIPISNSMLALSFHKMETGLFEVLAYLS